MISKEETSAKRQARRQKQFLMPHLITLTLQHYRFGIALDNKPLIGSRFVPEIALDINDSNQIQTAVQEIGNKFGKLDVLLNNAGVMLDGEWATSNASSVSIDTIRKTFDTNFFALVEVTQAFLPLILKSQSGRIVNMASAVCAPGFTAS